MSAKTLPLPTIVEPEDGEDVCTWVERYRSNTDLYLRETGAILFRGFAGTDLASFRRLAATTSHRPPLQYMERSSPRSEVLDRVYTSTDYPRTEAIELHNENSYQQDFPTRIAFFCMVAARVGGRTPIASNRVVKSRISQATLDRFRETGVLYQRNYNGGLGLRWQEVFNTTNRAAVEDYCAARGITCEWLAGERLRTRHKRPALRRHPYTGEEVWFNHALFFNVASLPDELSRYFVEASPEGEYPTHTYFGDGKAIPKEVIEELKDAYRKAKVSFDWKVGDILLLDNMLVAHGRESYEGDRKVYTFMQDAMSEIGPDVGATMNANPSERDRAVAETA